MSSRDLVAASPCGLFVIELLAVEAAVQDAYEAVAYGARAWWWVAPAARCWS